MDNPNAPDKEGIRPISKAVHNGYTDIVKILVPLTNNLNASDNNGETPIHWAATMGYTEIIKILAFFLRGYSSSSRLSKKWCTSFNSNKYKISSQYGIHYFLL